LAPDFPRLAANEHASLGLASVRLPNRAHCDFQTVFSEKLRKSVTFCDFGGLSYSLLNFVAKNCEKQMHRATVIVANII